VAYLVNTLHDYKIGERKNSPDAVMGAIASRMGENEINAVAEYAAGLK
jgi:cytochrome c553